MPHKDIKDREKEYLSIQDVIEQAQLNEICPCSSGKAFGNCCGRDMPCDCHSHLGAGECCYTDEAVKNRA